MQSAVGIIGVGQMGMAATQRLLAAGYSVHGYRRGSLEDFEALGGVSAASALAVSRAANTLLLLVPNAPALAEVMREISTALSPDKTLICLATLPVGDKQDASGVAARSGATLLDGEISGTAEMLKAGQASIMVAGAPEAFEAVRGVVSALVPSVSYLPTFGDAAKMKLVTNFLVAVHTLAAAEAIWLGRDLGLDPATLVSTISPSAGGSRMLAVRGPMMAARRFGAGNMPGFLRYFEMLRASIRPDADDHPLLDLTERLYRQAIEKGFGHLDIAAIHESLHSSPMPDARDE